MVIKMKHPRAPKIIINGYEIAGRMPMFQKPMRQAIREGVKNNTRRTRGLVWLTSDHFGIPICDWGLSEPPRQHDGKEVLWRWQGNKPPRKGDWFVILQSEVDDYVSIPLPCLYGKAGDVRTMGEPLIRSGSGHILYLDVVSNDRWDQCLDKDDTPIPWRWKRNILSSMFMPTEYGRTLCRIENIRVERLQDISEADAIAEGSQIPCDQLPKSCQQGTMTERDQFSRIWDSINGNVHPWSDNNMVWVIKFKLITRKGELG